MDMLVTPIQRNLKFHLPKNTVSQWNSAGVHVSQFFNTMSLFFPEGERFFINSVRHYRDRIMEPELLAAVRAFIGQEAMHGREHDEYNQAMINAGFPVDKMEAQVTSLLNLIRENSPPAFQLAITIALEHLTAIWLIPCWQTLNYWINLTPTSPPSGHGTHWKKQSTKPLPMMFSRKLSVHRCKAICYAQAHWYWRPVSFLLCVTPIIFKSCARAMNTETCVAGGNHLNING